MRTNSRWAGGPTMRKFWLLVPLVILGLFAHSRGQTQPDPQVKQAARLVPVKPRDPVKLPETAQPIFYSAQRAMEWLKRANRPDGRFVYGFQPALRVQLDGDNFASQAGAAFALA